MNNVIPCFLFRHKKIALSILKRSKDFQKKIDKSGALPVTKNPARKRYNLTLHTFFFYVTRDFIEFSAKSPCNICGKLVLTARLSIHVKTHSMGRSHMCEFCGRTFLHKNSLYYHMHLNHKGVTLAKNFVCTTCGYSCTWKSGLKIHEKTHTDERVKRNAFYLFTRI